MRRVTIRDVAERAGVAPMTVSRVVNNSGYVAQAVRTRVEAAVKELGYLPNQLARGLRSRRTGTLALLLTDVTNPYFTTVARGAEDAASDAGYLLLLCNSDEREDEEARYMRMLLEKQVDGVLLVPAKTGEASITLARQNGTPIVVLDRRSADPEVDVVRCDSTGGAHQLGELLWSLGHRDFAILAGPAEVSTVADRVQAFTAAVQGRTSLLHGDFTQASGGEMTRKAMQHVPRPTALFATNNFIAFGALQAMRALDIRTPEDVALVGFDDLPAPLVTFPFLTVASQPAYEMGQRAIELLIRRLDAKEPLPPEEVILPTELVIRRSSGDPVQSKLN